MIYIIGLKREKKKIKQNEQSLSKCQPHMHYNMRHPAKVLNDQIYHTDRFAQLSNI